jgi:hypothetical protein
MRREWLSSLLHCLSRRLVTSTLITAIGDAFCASVTAAICGTTSTKPITVSDDAF